MKALKQLEGCGQSPSLDYPKHSLIENEDLRALIERDGLKGVALNPSAWESDEYAMSWNNSSLWGDHGISAICEHFGDCRHSGARRRASSRLRWNAGCGQLYAPGRHVDAHTKGFVFGRLPSDLSETIANLRREKPAVGNPLDSSMEQW